MPVGLVVTSLEVGVSEGHPARDTGESERHREVASIELRRKTSILKTFIISALNFQSQNAISQTGQWWFIPVIIL